MTKLPPAWLVVAAICALALACLVVAQSPGRRGASAPDRQLLYDFRVDLPAPPNTVVGASEEDRILDATFANYLKDPEQCEPDASPSDEAGLAALRGRGQFAPHVSEAVRGSFTAAGREETLYLIAAGECGDLPRYLGSGTTQLVIRRGDENVVSLNGFYGTVSAVRDVNGDGADEVLLRAGGFGQGVLEESARLLGFAGGRERVVHDFETVHVNSCGRGDETSAIKAAVIRITSAPGARRPRFQTDFYTSRCFDEEDRPRLDDFRPLKRGKLYE